MSTQKEQKVGRKAMQNDDLEHFVKSETECCICSSPLVSQHEIDYLNLKIDETLECTQCKIVLKNTTSTLH